MATQGPQEITGTGGLRPVPRKAAQVHTVPATGRKGDGKLVRRSGRSRQTQQHSVSALAGLGGVRSPFWQGCAGDEAGDTDNGERGASEARSGVSGRDALDIAEAN